MKRFYVYLLLVCLLVFGVVSCFRVPPPAPSDPSQQALFSSSDLSNARKAFATTLEQVSGSDLENQVDDRDPDPIDPETDSDLTSQAILPGVDGFVVYIRTDGTTYQLWSHNQSSDATVLVYEGPYEIQSVAISGDGQTVLAVIKAPIVNNFEVYRFKLETSTIELLTNTATPEEDVSMNAVGNVLVWEGENSATGLRAVFIRDSSNDTTFTQGVLSVNTANQVDPSVSSNGTYIALVRELTTDRVLLYNRGTSVYTTVANRSNPTFDPSASDDGTQVLFLETTPTRQYLRVKNLTTGVISTELASSTPLEHPHLKGDGSHLTYGREVSGFTRLYTRDLASNAQALNAGGSWNHFGMYWQGPPPPPVTIEQEAVLTTTDFTYSASTGETVTIPGQSSSSLTVQVGAGVDDDLPVDTIGGIDWASRVVNLSVNGQPQWDEDDKIVITFPASANLSAQAVGDMTAVVTITDRDKRTVGVLYSPVVEAGQVTVELSKTVVDAVIETYLTAGEGVVYFAIQVADKVAQPFKPPVEGLFKINTLAIPSSDINRECNATLVNNLLTQIPDGVAQRPSKPTAIVMVHGWQAFEGLTRWQYSDTHNLSPHCSNWLQIMMAFKNQGGNWATLRANADLFSFRYDSDQRIQANGTKLSNEIQEHLGKYDNIIFLAHSMGGIVSVEARQQLDIRWGLVSLNSPYMGSVPTCTISNGQYCLELLDSIKLTSIIALTGNYEGTLDLTSYYPRFGSVGNPYLQSLWSDRANFSNIYSIHGNSGSSFANFSVFYKAIGGLATGLGWGPNDGIVPIASAVGTFEFTTDPYSSSVDKGLPNSVPLGRDHTQVFKGCTKCSDSGSDDDYDQQMNFIAFGLKSFLSGTLDTTFSGDGIVTTDIAGGQDQATSIAIDNNGKVVTAGFSNSDFAVVRYNPNGSLDNTFNGNGKVITEGLTRGRANSVAIDDDGRSVVAGNVDNHLVVVRYNIDGSLDNAFDNDGIVTSPIGIGSSANSVSIANNGKIVVAGGTRNCSGCSVNFAIVRYNPNGSLDTTFDEDGKVITDFGGDDLGSDVVIDSNGKIVVVGSTFNRSTGSDFAIARYNPDGSLDTTFDGDGKVITPVLGFDEAYSLVIDNNGKILVAGGSVNTNNDRDFTLVRYNTNGSLDTAFGGDGIVTTALVSGVSFEDIAYSIVIDGNSKIVAAGVTIIGSEVSDVVFMVVRYNSDGSLDLSFNGDGIVTTSIEGAGAQAVTIDSNGKIVAAGWNNGGAENSDFTIVRYNP
jgi:uncharacterized delta-60 repeat protein